MAGPTPGWVRQPAVAGLFYPADPQECRAAAVRLLDVSGQPESANQARALSGEPRWFGAIVPHAGWVCSGRIAGEAIATLARAARERSAPPDVVVVFGAVHTPLDIELAALDSARAWSEPTGNAPVPEALRAGLRENRDLFFVGDQFHRREHAVEVELPLIGLAFGSGVSVLPVEVPAVEEAQQIGRAVAKRVVQLGCRAAFIASSDLTHYGPAYQFAPAGVGIEGLRWAKENDRRLLDLVEQYRIDAIVAEAQTHQNACGAGAIAAMLAACREVGADKARVLRHASSYETLAALEPQPAVNAVGYAGVVVG